MAGPGVVAMRPGPSDINCLQGIYAAGGAGMGIKPLAGGEGGGYVVNVQVLGPTTALGWVGAAFVLLGAWVFYKTEPAPGSTKTEISSVPYKNTRIFYRERTILPVFACICLCLPVFTCRSLAAGVVGGLNYHLHVVRVAFLQTSRGDAHKLAVSLKLTDSAGTEVEHGLVQTTDQLVNHRG